jgi:pimeloyl-ACP methyl ester carboxylesterase
MWWQKMRKLFAPDAGAENTPTARTIHSSTPRGDWVACLNSAGSHRMVYYEWGDPDNPEVVICVHGLTRTGRDFDALAAQLSRHYRVICPDIAGRGLSDWLPVKSEYGIPRYTADCQQLIAKIQPQRLYWVGTSMGGLIGMTLAAQQQPIAKLVLNDVGAVIAAEALARIGSYLTALPRFSSLSQAQAYLRQIHAPFGPLTDAQWAHLTLHSVRQEGDGHWVLHYDPGIAFPFLSAFAPQTVDLWPLYEAVRCPTLLIRGAESDLLPRTVAQAMTERGPCATLVEFPGIGHAPALLDQDQIAVVRDFLLDQKG